MTTHLHPSAVQHARSHLALIPRPDHIAIEKIRLWAKAQDLSWDPDTTVAVTLHYKPNPEGGWLAQVVEQMSLGQAVMCKWQEAAEGHSDVSLDIIISPAYALNYLGVLKEWRLVQQSWSEAFADGHVHFVDSLPAGGLFGTLEDYAVYQGLFHVTEPMQYTPETQLSTDTRAFQQFIWDLDFHDEYMAQLDAYWLQQSDDYATLARVNFIAACNKQVEEGSLSEAGCALAWRTAGIVATDEATAAQHSQPEARMLNFYGYVATDIPCITDPASGRTLLYIPGNSSPLHEFESVHAMKAWLVEQCRDATRRGALMLHFRLQDLHTGISYSGLEATLQGLASYRGQRFLSVDNVIIPASGWSTAYINYKRDDYSPVVKGDLFKHIALRQQQRSHDDAEFLITLNSDVIKAKWRGYLSLTMNMLSPLALVVPGLGWLVAAGGIAQLALGLDEVINAKSLEAQTEGLLDATFGALSAAPLAGQAWSGGKRFFQTQFDGFVAPGRLNGQIGYRLSPPGAPKPYWAGNNFNRYFEQPVRVEPVPPSEHEPLLTRQTTHTELDTLVDPRDPQTSWVYDLDADAFVKQSDMAQAQPTRYVAQHAQLSTVQPQGNAPRVVTDAMRESTLRSLGINLPLPVEVPRVTEVGQYAIPRRVMHLWTGDNPIPADLLTRVSRNSRLLKDAGYSHYLYLSTKNAEAFASNSRALADVAPDVQVLPLEQQNFYTQMGFTRQFYLDAMEGPVNGTSHLTAANDMLKYHALYHEGGVYMDINDDLLAPPAHGSAAGIVNDIAPGDWIGNVPLQTTPEGLLLGQPASNPFRGLHLQYGTSVIGSHPGNPTLREVIREMEQRLHARPGFFTQKRYWPVKGAHAPKFAAYAKAVSELTGVGMFNHVVDNTLPAYRQMRQIYKLLGCPLLKYPKLLGADLQPVTNTELQSTLHGLFGLSRIVRVNKGFGWRNLNG